VKDSNQPTNQPSIMTDQPIHTATNRAFVRAFTRRSLRILQAKQAKQESDTSDLLNIFKSLVSSPFTAEEIRAAGGKAEKLPA
jgi:hypothetical protein